MLEKNLSSTCLPSFQPDSPQKTMRHRRKRVPLRPANSINYLALMKNCIGKDLSKIPMPVDFNEPLSALQRATEDLEYSHLLDSAGTEHANPTRRLALVAAFAISTYSTTGMRTTKPFNPMLGETFECDRRVDKSWRSLAEQVSHHPPTYALYAEGKSWILNQSYTITTKIKGRSLCVQPVGSTYLRFLDNNDLFVFGKVCTSSTMTNIVSGRLQTDNYGDLVIFNSTTGDKCMLKFHEQGGLFSREVARKVSGTVIDAASKPKYRVEAIWDQYANIYHLDSNENVKPEERLWTANKPPKNFDKMHSFTEFAIELNELEPGVAPTDSRLRPDQRLMENGEWTEANLVKQKLEEAQRRRANSEKRSLPIWFDTKREEEMVDKNDVYVFTGDYWTKKEQQDWSQCPKIFSVE
ncbi:oxysterol-binding protein domain-containing protein [Ditylenchus destructor]|uniref:Oxysterol-binding protein domain-containing protein n=1 Tax=Ditylenchus destructor TaxID=166010 RepID=A0AAD4ND25_9BILA|nr:oxysterol-binding protein domain-containing protein [Ditylenchus destructor]